MGVGADAFWIVQNSENKDLAAQVASLTQLRLNLTEKYDLQVRVRHVPSTATHRYQCQLVTPHHSPCATPKRTSRPRATGSRSSRTSSTRTTAP